MRPKITRYATKVTFFATVVLATCLFGRPANAQSEIQGKFTLPFEARWGRAVLPAGPYLLTSDHSSTGTMLVIRDAKSGRVIAYEPAVFREDSTTGESALLVGTQGKQRVVHSAKIAELGLIFVYDPQLAGRPGEEARKTQAVPVIVAKQ